MRGKKHTGPAEISSLLDILGYQFNRPGLLETALTHSSLAAESANEDPTRDNEQLEFVGDAVLGLIVAEALYTRFPALTEGELTRMRALLVSRSHLGEMAEAIDLGKYLRLGRGEEQSGGRQKRALLSNALEAVIAAMYLDGGLPPARSFVEQHIIAPKIADLTTAVTEGARFGGAIGDYKSALQEFLQARGKGQPKYTVVEESGPDHKKRFRVQVLLREQTGDAAEAEGRTKKEAQQAAARVAYERLLASDV
ncbi:ribonuclease III [Terriglobus tenax]|uniref:ribonuclease III n=1 Tax=Terriglobus tenax TaxID=1111115 RepID=UPI0021E04E77|nr:ribonuclease III [Terriglobus tenax]